MAADSPENLASEKLGDLAEGAAEIAALAGRDGSTFIVVGTDGEMDANDVIDDVTDEFGVGRRPTESRTGWRSRR